MVRLNSHVLIFRLGYAVWILETIIQANQAGGNELFVMHDIACSLHRHLNVSLKSQYVYCTSECILN